MKFDVVYAVSVTRWVVVEGVEAATPVDAEQKVREAPPVKGDPRTQENVTTRVVAHDAGSRLARLKQTNAGPVFEDGNGI